MNADPRRPDKVQRYVAKNANSGEDLTPDYMNIMGQHTTTGNAAGEAASDKQPEPPAGVEQNLQGRQAALEDTQNDVLVVTSNAANVIPTSPQYGVAIIPNNNGTELPAVPVENNANLTTTNETPTEPVPPKPAPEETKDVHSTPSRNDRFKVVKIASLEPFKRGRWKCMDYVDEAPPPSVVNNPITKPGQSLGNNMIPSGYMQSQSLPQQQIQQMIMQGGYTNGGQFIPNVPQMMPQAQYFYPQVGNVPNQNMAQQIGSSMPAQFMNNQQYFPAGVVTNAQGYSLPQGYQNMQYMQMPPQNSAFVPTSQTMQMPNSYQQGQTYGGQTNVSQTNMTQPQMMNGHAYPPPHETQQMNQQPNQAVKNVVNSMPQQNVMQQQPMPNHLQQHQQPVMQQQQQQQYQPQSGTYQPGASMTQQQPQQNTHQSQTNVQASVMTPIMTAPSMQPMQQVSQQHQVQVQQQHQIDNMVYNNPQFSNSANSVTVVANSEIAPNSGTGADVPETNSVAETTVSEGTDDPSKGAVVNAIDNKIEQAMDLVKSHLMYTVREEVEVLKEKISELMEKIQQLETENNYLRSQIPKTQPALPPVQNAAPVYNNPVASQPQNMVPLQQNVIPPVNQMPQIPQGNVMGTVNVPTMPQHQPHSIPQQSHPQQGMPHPQSMPPQQHLPPQQHNVIPNSTAIPQSYDKAPNE